MPLNSVLECVGVGVGGGGEERDIKPSNFVTAVYKEN